MNLRRYFGSVIWRLCVIEMILLLNPLFNFKPMKGLKYWGDAKMFWSASNSTYKSILNMLKALNLSDR